MSAVLKLLEPVTSRPAYDNTSLGDELVWIAANERLLRLWWNDCKGGVGPLTEADYRAFRRSQHEIQIMLRNRGES